MKTTINNPSQIIFKSCMCPKVSKVLIWFLCQHYPATKVRLKHLKKRMLLGHSHDEHKGKILTTPFTYKTWNYSLLDERDKT